MWRRASSHERSAGMSLTTQSTLDVIGPLGGRTITFVESAISTNGDQTTVEVDAMPFLGEDHIHPSAEERIEVLEGEVTVKVGDNVLHLTPGEEVVIPRNVVHSWSNESRGAVRVRIRFRPGLAIETYLRTTYGLHRDGRVDSAGKLSLLQLAVLSADYREMVVFELNPRRRAFLRVMAPLGRFAGYRSAYPQYQPAQLTESV